jgi:hypothetical protein
MSLIGNIGNIFKSIFNNEGLHKEAPSKKSESAVKSFNLKSMTKKQLEEHGKTLGIELDRRQTKSKLIAKIKAAQ